MEHSKNINGLNTFLILFSSL